MSDAKFTYTYDANGNVISKADKFISESISYAYDSENRLSQVILSNGKIVSFKYDALGRRIEKSIDGNIQRYVYDDENIIAIINGLNNPIAIFTHGPGTDEPLLMKDSTGGEVFLHADGLGSIIAHTDVAGNLIERIEYESYGAPIFVDVREVIHKISSTSFTNSPYTFTGREYDSSTQLQYNRARYYDNFTGRFITEDPDIFRKGEVNHYRYAFSNPLLFTDPSGNAAAIVAPVAVPGLWPVIVVGGLVFILANGDVRDYIWDSISRTGEDEGITEEDELARRKGESCPLPPKYPGNDPTKPPGPGWERRGGEKGAWHNPGTGESLRPDLNHPTHGPHWDWKFRGPGSKGRARIYPDGRVEIK